MYNSYVSNIIFDDWLLHELPFVSVVRAREVLGTPDCKIMLAKYLFAAAMDAPHEELVHQLFSKLLHAKVLHCSHYPTHRYDPSFAMNHSFTFQIILQRCARVKNQHQNILEAQIPPLHHDIIFFIMSIIKNVNNARSQSQNHQITEKNVKDYLATVRGNFLR